jgi:hypothetical protein
VDLLVQHGEPSSMTSALVELYSKLVRGYLISHLFYLMDGINNVYCIIGVVSVNVPKDFLFSFIAFSFLLGFFFGYVCEEFQHSYK